MALYIIFFFLQILKRAGKEFEGTFGNGFEGCFAQHVGMREFPHIENGQTVMSSRKLIINVWGAFQGMHKHLSTGLWMKRRDCAGRKNLGKPPKPAGIERGALLSPIYSENHSHCRNLAFSIPWPLYTQFPVGQIWMLSVLLFLTFIF